VNYVLRLVKWLNKSDAGRYEIIDLQEHTEETPCNRENIPITFQVRLYRLESHSHRIWQKITLLGRFACALTRCLSLRPWLLVFRGIIWYYRRLVVLRYRRGSEGFDTEIKITYESIQLWTATRLIGLPDRLCLEAGEAE
jgi:hypothetical protein